MSNREIVVCSDLNELGRKAAAEFMASAHDAIRDRSRFCVALSGGSTPLALYQRLAAPEFTNRIEWKRVHLFWGDDRCVPPDHPESNYRLAYDSFVSKIPIPKDNIHRMAGEKEPPAAAAEYEGELRDFFGVPAGAWPRFDFILLGVGEDGHTASLFPGTQALKERERWVAANYVPKLGAYRLTLTLPVLNHGRYDLFLVAGASKAPAIGQILGRDTNTNDLTNTRDERGSSASSVPPAAQVRPGDGRLVWLLTRDAAGELPLPT